MALTGLDDPAQRAIVVVSVGRSLMVLIGSIGTVLISCLLLMVVGLFFPLWVGSYDVRVVDLLLGVGGFAAGGFREPGANGCVLIPGNARRNGVVGA
ncbi:hypothetical protein [Streptomyces sp. rh34]|uniref:hypothetical protein n=1 Tax=Streptomyces sp. rh34 TaxID=2034272 RepID=UPI000BEFCC05|nr:hypothetical protein [Streptomyces sp. rh34]